MGHTSGPDVQMFRRFQKHWKKIDRVKFKSAMTNERDLIADVREDTIKFAIQQLDSFQPQNDYKELLEFLIVFHDGDHP